MVDEPLAMTAADQAHLGTCAECCVRLRSVSNVAQTTASLLRLPSFEAPSDLALIALWKRIKCGTAPHGRWYRQLLNRNRSWRSLARPAIVAAAATMLILSVTVTGIAVRFIRVFEPKQIVAVQVSQSTLRSSNAAPDYGTLKWFPQPPTPQRISDAASARALSGLPVLMPTSVPSGVNGPVAYVVVEHVTGSITLDAARLRASVAKNGARAGPMPSAINGSTLIVSVGPALIEVWSAPSTTNQLHLSTLVIAQTRVPTVDSTGATTTDIENYLLAQPEIPPELAAQLKAIRDPSTTLPIPIPEGLATTESVQINGVQGVLIKSALGAGVAWVKHGIIYAVGGQMTPGQVLALAASLQ
jgi:hypothetical protein